MGYQTLNLSNDDRKQLRQAIESAYPDPEDLRIFVDEALNQNLAVIAGSGGPYSTVTFNLIKWAIAKGYIDDLVLALAKDTQNPNIQRFCGRVLQQRLRLNATEPSLGEASWEFEPSAWDLDISAEELEFFLPQQFSLESDVGTLLRGLELANAVCKVTFSDRPPEACGTGVLIAPDLVLTNYHVLSQKSDADLNAIARSAQLEFGYISPKFGEVIRTQTVKPVEANPVVSASPVNELDYALLRIQPGEDFSVKPVAYDAKSALMPKSPLNLLQHPEGEEIKVSLSNNGVVKANEQRGLVLYVNATKRGSSGSPCFNSDWKLVALHHKNMVTSFGSVREGILFSAIYPHISSVL